ncbi:MAG: glutathione S-transferase, partial [Rhodothermales bacterium]
TAICIMLAEKHPEAALIPADPAQRSSFWQAVLLASSTLETPTVNYFLASRGVVDERWRELAGEGLKARLETFAASVPSKGYLCGSFSIADICAAYVLRVAVQAGLLPCEGVLADYFNRLKARPAALESRIFDSLRS